MSAGNIFHCFKESLWICKWFLTCNIKFHRGFISINIVVDYSSANSRKKMIEIPCSPNLEDIYIHILVCVCVCKISYMTVVKGETKTPFTILYWIVDGGWTLFLGLLNLPLICTLFWILNKVASRTIFQSFAWLHQGLNDGLLAHWRTL